MNQTNALPTAAAALPLNAVTGDTGGAPAPGQLATVDILQSRFAFRLASRLTEGAQTTLGPEITERLRFAREQALERARAARSAASVSRLGVTAGGAMILGRSGPMSQAGGWWFKLASVLPALALIAGLVAIERWQDNAQVSVAAEIDAALLSDDLPPTAYSDAGFGEFLKNSDQ